MGDLRDVLTLARCPATDFLAGIRWRVPIMSKVVAVSAAAVKTR